MGLVAITLLATLLPTGILIAILVLLSSHFYFQYRASRASVEAAKKNEDQPAEAAEPVVQIGEIDEDLADPMEQYRLSDAANPDWRSDAIDVLCHLPKTGMMLETSYQWGDCSEPEDESWATELLAELGYTGNLSVPLILSLLRQLQAYDSVVNHIMFNVIMPLLSLECDPEESLLPFTPAQHRGLRDLYKALESKELSPDATALVSRIPFQFAETYAEQHVELPGEGTRMPALRFNKKVYVRLNKLFTELFSPILPLDWVVFELDRHGKSRTMGRWGFFEPRAMDACVELHLRMMFSKQQFEWKWNGKTTADGAFVERFPSLIAAAGHDGMLLKEPKIWYEGSVRDMSEEEKSFNRTYRQTGK